MKRVRIGNGFQYVMVVERLGQAEDLTVVISPIMKLKTKYDAQIIPFEIIDGNKVRVEITSKIIKTVGEYNLEFSYLLPDASFEDDNRECATDIKCFKIVSESEDADEPTDFSSIVDVAIGFKGDSAFQVWQSQTGNEGKTYDDYIAYLREPMTLAIEEGEQTAAEWAITEAERVAEELIRKDDEEERRAAEVIREQVKDATIIAKNEAIQATIDANDAASLANTKAVLANDAAILANSKAGLADSAATNANNKAGLANAATTNANDAAALANSKAGIAQTAADNANAKATLANTAATNANTVATNVANAEAARVASGAEVKTNKTSDIETNKTSVDKYPNVKGVVDYVAPLVYSEAIQLIKLHNPNLVFKGFVTPSTPAQTHIVNVAYIAIESGTVFGITGVVKGQIIKDDGSIFTKEYIEPQSIKKAHIALSKANIALYNKEIVSESNFAGYMTTTPTGSVTGSSLHVIKRHVVVAGETIYLAGTSYVDASYALYAFTFSTSFTGQVVQLGTTGIGYLSVNEKIVVPAGAGYLMVTNHADFDIKVFRSERLKTLEDVKQPELVYKIDEEIPIVGNYNIKTALKALENTTLKIREISFWDGLKRVFYKYIGNENTRYFAFYNWEKVNEALVFMQPISIIATSLLRGNGIQYTSSSSSLNKYNYSAYNRYYYEGMELVGNVLTIAFFSDTHNIVTGDGFLGYLNLNTLADNYIEINLDDYAMIYGSGITESVFKATARYIYISARNTNYKDVNYDYSNRIIHFYKKGATKTIDVSEIPVLPIGIEKTISNVELIRASQIKNIPLPKKDISDTLKILYIGSSWTQDNAMLVRNVAMGSSLNVKVGNWYRGSCTYQDMLNNFVTSEITYIDYNADGTNVNTNNFSIKDALLSDIWDIIMLTDSAQNQNYHVTDFTPEKEILRLVKMYAPNATIATYFGWVFQYNKLQPVWNSNLERCKTDIIRTGVDIVVPTGIALWSMLSAYDDGTYNILYRNSDQTHLSYGFARYIAACTNFVALVSPVFGVSIFGNTYRCADVVGAGVAGDYTITEQQALDCQKFALSANSDRWNFRDMSSEI